MPLKLNVGLQKKIGQPDYGSLGASCHLEVEVEASLVRETDQLREKIRYLFAQAKLAVEEELSGSQQEAGGNNGNGRHDNGGNGQRRLSGNERGATSAQIRALHAIAGRNRIDLSTRLGEDFGVSHPEDLSISQASELIDSLKSSATGGRR